MRIEIDRAANAAYVRLRQGNVAPTRELIEGHIYADLDVNGNILGDDGKLPNQVARWPRFLMQLATGNPVASCS